MTVPIRETPRSLRIRLWELQDALMRVEADLLTLDPGNALPGMYAIIEIGTCRALVSTARVKEIVRLLAFTPLPNHHPHVPGTFICRGQPVVAVDLASWLGAPREPALDAHILVVGGARPFGLVVDQVRSLVMAPILLTGDAEGAVEPWRGSNLAVGLCRADDQVLPLLSLAPLDRHVTEVLQ